MTQSSVSPCITSSNFYSVLLPHLSVAKPTPIFYSLSFYSLIPIFFFQPSIRLLNLKYKLLSRLWVSLWI